MTMGTPSAATGDLHWAHTLLAKLSAVLFVLFCIIGLTAFSIGRYATDMYHQELTQRLNLDIAEHIAADQPLMQNGQPNLAALKDLAHYAMVINPTTEIYLLDPTGKVLGHALPEASVQVDTVQLAPIVAFISGSADLPLLGQDPRNPDKQKVFSAAPIVEQGQLQGYLYTILGGKFYDNLSVSVQDSYVLTISSTAIVVAVVFGFLAGIAIFHLLTRRLRRLTRYVEVFQRGDFSEPFNPPLSNARHSDEINALMLAFKAMATRINHQYTALKELDRNRRELITNISHDLRTPLVSVQGYLETVIIKHDSLNDSEKLTYLKKALRHGKRLRKLIAELFELSRLDSNSLQPKIEQFHLLELLQDLAQDFTYQASRRNIRLSVLPPSGEFCVYADIAMIQRVLENLIENALRYTPRGGWVKVLLEEDDQQVSVHITDSGCGITSHDIPKIFDRFYRGSRLGAKDTGTGLGLAIVKRILDLHHTPIQVKSAPDRGTAFTFSLPSQLAAH
ncbi:HAMP domain-containing histidine kinase [Exilibacterium tricleocarpae]|uniref:histidine kinase n=1 Tax=Exilibacterium tricleocarpae TaxID=2591008 RepID=A0A545T0E9_9GAMM|nr:HAMP domain-containing sensor histidine kinase [Exilibacterium tricleocarpae]TQV70695.1 HAMP domain-containing histidine kinase [Exilibacterium tricleocarpae]